METLTSPSPELKKHVDDLRRDAGYVAQDVKKQANDAVSEIKAESQARFEDVKGTVADLFDSVKSYAVAHPVGVFGAGVLLGFVFASRARR